MFLGMRGLRIEAPHRGSYEELDGAQDYETSLAVDRRKAHTETHWENDWNLGQNNTEVNEASECSKSRST